MAKLTLAQALEAAKNAGAAAPGTFKAQVWETGSYRCNILRANYSFRFENHQIGIHLEREEDKSKQWVNVRIPGISVEIVDNPELLSDEDARAYKSKTRMINSALVQLLGLGFSDSDIATCFSDDGSVIVSGIEALVTRIPGRVVDVDVFKKEKNTSTPNDPKFALYLNNFKLISGGDSSDAVVEEEDDDLFS